MSNGVNKAILIGNLGADPELRKTGNGTSVCNFRVATSRKFTNKDGDKREQTEWHRIVVWGKLAEHCNAYLSKGRQVYIEGRLQTRAWDDREGQKRFTTEVVAEAVTFLSGGRRQEASASVDTNEVPAAELTADPSLSEEAAELGLGADGDVPF